VVEALNDDGGGESKNMDTANHATGGDTGESASDKSLEQVRETETNPSEGEAAPSDDCQKPENVEPGGNNAVNGQDTHTLERCQYWLEKDQRQLPSEKIFAMLVLWMGLILLTFLLGGKGVGSIVGITCSSPWYGVLTATQFLWTFGISTIFAIKTYKATQEKLACGYPFHPQDPIWDFSKIRSYCLFTFIAGVIAGLIGIGGGMILGPLMLVMGVYPQVSAATTATMIVLTSSSVAVLSVTAGLVPWEYAVTFFFDCMVGAYVGKMTIDGYVKRHNKASLLVFLLATIILFATVGVIVIVLKNLAAADWCLAGFNKFCSVSSSDDEEESYVCPGERMLFSDVPLS
jgi:uncharacterized membrane protein YfcA